MAAKKRKTGRPESSAARKERRKRKNREKPEEKQTEEEEEEAEEEEGYDHDSPDARARRTAFLQQLSPSAQRMARGLWAARGWWVPP